MGWIKERYMRTGHGLSHGHETSARMTAPLRKITEFVREGDNSLFGRGDLMKLECGHQVFTNGDKKARCIYCLKEIQNL